MTHNSCKRSNYRTSTIQNMAIISAIIHFSLQWIPPWRRVLDNSPRELFVSRPSHMTETYIYATAIVSQQQLYENQTHNIKCCIFLNRKSHCPVDITKKYWILCSYSLENSSLLINTFKTYFLRWFHSTSCTFWPNQTNLLWKTTFISNLNLANISIEILMWNNIRHIEICI